MVSDPAEAQRNPELAVLSGVAHGRGPVEVAIEIAHAALAACARYPDERALLYSDLVLAALSEAARTALEDLMRKGYEYQSEFAKRHRAEGKAEGKVEAEARAVLTVLEARKFGVTDQQRARILASTDLAELERWLRRAATLSDPDELFG